MSTKTENEGNADWRTQSGERQRRRHVVPPANEGALPAWRNRLSNLALTTIATGRVHTSNGVNHVGAGVSPKKR